MSVNQASNISFDFSKLNSKRETGKPLESGEFALQLAEFQTQNLNTLISTAFNGSSSETGSDALLGDSKTTGSAGGLSATGRNNALFDPESGYKMMSVINRQEVSYKAEFAALHQMKDEILQVQRESEDLTRLQGGNDNAKIRKELQEFVDEYNGWIKEFDDEMQAGGALAESNAARIARYELDQSVENPFLGGRFGLHGMADLGLTIDPVSKQAKLDTGKLDQALQGNRNATIETIRDFSGHFVTSAQLLNANNNFINNRLANLDKVIHYIDANKTSLQAEFGLGDKASPSSNVAQALATYGKISRA